MSGDLIFPAGDGAPAAARLPSWSVLFNITRNPAGGLVCNVLPTHGDRRAVIVGSERQAYECVAAWLEASARQIRQALFEGEVRLIHPGNL